MIRREAFLMGWRAGATWASDWHAIWNPVPLGLLPGSQYGIPCQLGFCLARNMESRATWYSDCHLIGQ